MKSERTGEGGFFAYLRKKKRLCAGLGAALTLIALLSGIKNFSSDQYLRGKDGEVEALLRKEDREDFDLRLEVVQKGRAMKKEVLLHFAPKKEKPAEGKGEEREALEREIRKVSRQVTEAKGKKIPLPKSDGKGTVYHWRRKRNLKPLLLPLFCPLLLYLLYDGEKRKQRAAEQEEIRRVKRELPAFSHQLLLLLSAGLIFTDAYGRIAEGCRDAGEEEPLKRLIASVYRETLQGTGNLADIFDRHCRKKGIRELSRLSSLFVEQQNRGSDLTEKLQMESEILWNGRKKDAEVQGKLGETKLSFPLAILLVALIIVTAAPAMLEM